MPFVSARVLAALLFVAGLMLGGARPAGAGTLEDIRQKGFLACDVSTGVSGYSMPDAQGHWRGFDVDLCRAVAAAVLGDSEKVKFLPFSAQQRFSALQSG